MGYYTRFTLEWSATKDYKASPACGHANGPKAKFCQECGRPTTGVNLDAIVGKYIAEHEDINGAISTDGKPQDSVKWYDAETDMRRMSKEIPGVLFKLSGEGENAGDIWAAYALDGKWQKHKAKIVVAEMSPRAWT